jgi:hypothetical protein
MIRTQIQLSEKQAKALKEIARRQHVSMAELIRRGVDVIIVSSYAVDPEARKKRAVDAAGRFSSGKGDVSRKHDDYLVEAMKP